MAVLGILAINITGFWGPSLATFSPVIPYPETGAASWFAFAFVLFEGKMRALFTLLFGASMVLFAHAAERQGTNPDIAQMRRLLWLMLFGYLHFALLWWGDILFSYALCGVGALFFLRLSPWQLLGIALPFYALSQGIEALLDLPGVLTEQAILAGTAPATDVAQQAAMMDRIAASVAKDMAVLDAGFIGAIRLKLAQSALQPLTTTLSTFTETLPLMLTGMALLRLGLFSDWPRRRLALVAAWHGAAAPVDGGRLCRRAGAAFPPRTIHDAGTKADRGGALRLQQLHRHHRADDCDLQRLGPWAGGRPAAPVAARVRDAGMDRHAGMAALVACALWSGTAGSSVAQASGPILTFGTE